MATTKEETKEDGMDKLIDSVKNAVTRVEHSLSKMHSSDLDGAASHGLNECGLKFALLPYLDGDYFIESERDVEGGRLDLLISDGENALVIELKYVRCGFMTGAKYGVKDALSTKFKKFNDFAAKLSTMSWDDLKKESYRLSSGGRITVEAEVKEAWTQAERYVAALKHGHKDPLPASIKNVKPFVIIGVGNRVFGFG